ncbi:unnamed protein product [Parnassius mnemosyne]|uniref:Uncharacterized protein n=1 Tax=Parnassius mnemosyne TaxID=213953 RepID=A0AAV1K7Q3_9NEOP
MLAKETGLTALLFNVVFDLYRYWGSIRRSSPTRCRWKEDSIYSRVARSVGALALLAIFRIAMLQGSLPTFSPQDNPPAFHPSYIVRADLAVLPHNAKLHYNFANFLKDIEQQESAIKHYKEALKKKNKINESIKMLERCISLEPRFVHAYLELLLVAPQEDKRDILDKLLELEPKNWEHYQIYGNWFKERDGRLCEETKTAARRWAVTRTWRLRSELADRAAKYARAPLVTSTCLHHSKFEVSSDVYKINNAVKENTRTFLYKYDIQSVSKQNAMNDVEKASTENSCQKNILHSDKEGVSLSAQYKPIHNKSETGHKHKSCRLHKKKKIKEPESFVPFVSDHLIKTY